MFFSKRTKTRRPFFYFFIKRNKKSYAPLVLRTYTLPAVESISNPKTLRRFAPYRLMKSVSGNITGNKRLRLRLHPNRATPDFAYCHMLNSIKVNSETPDHPPLNSRLSTQSKEKTSFIRPRKTHNIATQHCLTKDKRLCFASSKFFPKRIVGSCKENFISLLSLKLIYDERKQTMV